jgi:transposase
MRDIDFLTTLLRIETPWEVTKAEVDVKRTRVDVAVEWRGPGRCPTCGREAPKYDHRERIWRDLDLCGEKLYIHAIVPRIDCPSDGIATVSVPCADGRSDMPSRFESYAISLLGEMSIAAVARRLDVGWDTIDAIMSRAARRGLARRATHVVRHIGIDEKSIKKGHKYFTIVSDLDRGVVLWIGTGRRRETIDSCWATVSAELLAGIEGIAMDMWLPYFESTMAHVPNAAEKIVFDKFHIVSYLTKAVDLTRREIMRDRSLDRTALKGTKYWWLRNLSNMKPKDRSGFALLRTQYGALARAWTLKESFAHFWQYRSEAWARRFFSSWYGWAVRSRLPAMAEVARMLKRHFANIITYIQIPITNAASESINSKIQKLKTRANGYRNEARFATAILFHCGGLDLHPTHSNS